MSEAEKYVEVELRFLGFLTQVTGCGKMSFKTRNKVSLASLLEKIGNKELCKAVIKKGKVKRNIIVLIDGSSLKGGEKLKLKNGSKIVFMPLIGGG